MKMDLCSETKQHISGIWWIRINSVTSQSLRFASIQPALSFPPPRLWEAKVATQPNTSASHCGPARSIGGRQRASRAPLPAWAALLSQTIFFPNTPYQNSAQPSCEELCPLSRSLRCRGSADGVFGSRLFSATKLCMSLSWTLHSSWYSSGWLIDIVQRPRPPGLFCFG